MGTSKIQLQAARRPLRGAQNFQASAEMFQGGEGSDENAVGEELRLANFEDGAKVAAATANKNAIGGGERSENVRGLSSNGDQVGNGEAIAVLLD